MMNMTYVECLMKEKRRNINKIQNAITTTPKDIWKEKCTNKSMDKEANGNCSSIAVKETDHHKSKEKLKKKYSHD